MNGVSLPLAPATFNLQPTKMKLSISPAEVLLAAVIAGVLALAGWQFFGGGDAGRGSGPVKIKVPTLSAQAATGQAAFDVHCAQCHGKDGGGTNQGPPFVHDIYNPGHHSDEASLGHRLVRRAATSWVDEGQESVGCKA